jgi:hypothetical protein
LPKNIIFLYFIETFINNKERQVKYEIPTKQVFFNLVTNYVFFILQNHKGSNATFLGIISDKILKKLASFNQNGGSITPSHELYCISVS